MLCGVLSLHKNCWRSVGAQLWEADMISSLAFVPIKAADGIIVGYVHSFPARLTKMQDQTSWMLRWLSVVAHFGTW